VQAKQLQQFLNSLSRSNFRLQAPQIIKSFSITETIALINIANIISLLTYKTEELRILQTPLKEKYRSLIESAAVTLKEEVKTKIEIDEQNNTL